MKKIDVSKIKTGKEFSEEIFSSMDNCWQIVGEECNPILSLINESEPIHKFEIGDMVKLNKKILKFNGVYNNSKYLIVGMEKIGDQFIYVIEKDGERYNFFGYELEKSE